MELNEFLFYLYSGASDVFHRFVGLLSNADLKALRLVLKPVAPGIFPYMFRRIYISANEDDLEVFYRIAAHERTRLQVREIFWDDTIFDTETIQDIETYTARVDAVKPIDPRKVSEADLRAAYGMWSQCASVHKRNRKADREAEALAASLARFPNLRSITILSRSRLTYVDPQAYWQVWQTPRSRAWRRKPFARALLDPEPFKPSFGTTVTQSEGMHALRAVEELIPNCGLQVGALVVESIGGGQSRASGVVASHRYERKWLVDLGSLTEQEQGIRLGSGQIALRLLIETQTEDLWRHVGIRESEIWVCILCAAASLEELSVSATCLDWFWTSVKESSQAALILRTCSSLRKLSFRSSWCLSPLEMLRWFQVNTSVQEVEFSLVDMEGSSWPDLIRDMRQEQILFDRFDVKACRSASDVSGVQGRLAWDAPWHGTSETIVPWLRGESFEMPVTHTIS